MGQPDQAGFALALGAGTDFSGGVKSFGIHFSSYRSRVKNNFPLTSVREWYHIRSPGENIFGLKKGHDTLYTAFGEIISQNTHR